MILCVSKINVNKAWIQAKIHAEPASQKSFANQWCRMPTWHGEWRHREISYRKNRERTPPVVRASGVGSARSVLEVNGNNAL